jgi:hypothetical protein
MMWEIGFSHEHYDGFWNAEGRHVDDPAGSDLNQYTLNTGFAYRLANRWQASIQLPYVWNDNHYTGTRSNTSGIGDMSLGLWYETFDDIKCIWKVTDWASLMPAIYLGSTLTLPTGKSAYSGDVDNSFDITGRGSYRLDANLFIEKTIYPWSAALSLAYGKYLERPVNEEFGRAVEPYDRRLGDRFSSTLTVGYTHFLASLDTLTISTSFSHLQEQDGEIDGNKDAAVLGFKKQSVGLSFAYSKAELDWVYKLSFNHALQGHGRGENFPTTNLINLGISYAIR